VNALLRSITLFTAIALLLFVGLHAVVPHDHPGQHNSFHGSEIPPIAHAENKLFALVFIALLFSVFSASVYQAPVLERRDAFLFWSIDSVLADTIPIRYNEALRKGRIHSRAD